MPHRVDSGRPSPLASRHRAVSRRCTRCPLRKLVHIPVALSAVKRGKRGPLERLFTLVSEKVLYSCVPMSSSYLHVRRVEARGKKKRKINRALRVERVQHTDERRSKRRQITTEKRVKQLVFFFTLHDQRRKCGRDEKHSLFVFLISFSLVGSHCYSTPVRCAYAQMTTV